MKTLKGRNVLVDCRKQTIEEIREIISKQLDNAKDFANRASSAGENVDDYMKRFVDCESLEDYDMIYLMQDELCESYDYPKGFVDSIMATLMHNNDRYSGSAFYDVIEILDATEEYSKYI